MNGKENNILQCEKIYVEQEHSPEKEVDPEIVEPIYPIVSREHQIENIKELSEKANIWKLIHDYFLNRGVPQEHLQHSYLTLLSLMAAPLGKAVALVMSYEGKGDATHVLDICSQIVPEKFLVTFGDLNPHKLFSVGHEVGNRTIVGYDAVKFKGVRLDILRAGKNNSVSMHQISSKQGESFLEKKAIEGSLGLVTIAHNGKDLELLLPEAFNLRLLNYHNNADNILRNLEQGYSNGFKDFKDSYIQTWLNMAEPRKVTIPYSKEILEGLKPAPEFNTLAPFVLMMISTITIIRQAPQPTLEILAELGLKYSIHDILKCVPKYEPQKTCTSTLEDYYLCYHILDGLFHGSEMNLGECETLVYQVLKEINLRNVNERAWLSKNMSLGEKVETIPLSEIYTALYRNIFKEVNKRLKKQGLNEYSDSKIRRALDTLREKKWINWHKKGKCSIANYFILRATNEANGLLPSPKEIAAAMGYPTEGYTFFNPITGTEEDID